MTPVTRAPGPDPEGPSARADRPAQDAGLGGLPVEVLVRRASLGDRHAFAVIANDQGAVMFRYAVSMLGGDVHDAQDATQNAMIKAWQRLPELRNPGGLRTWLLRITANEVRALRRGRRTVPVDDWLFEPVTADRRDTPESRLDAEELRRELVLALGELPWRQRACWVLAEQEGLSYEEIAETLETTVTVVRGQLHRARANLSSRMAQWR